MRPAVPERAPDRADHRAVQGRGAGADGYPGRPGQPAVRPDHQPGGTPEGPLGQAVRRHAGETRGSVQGRPDRGRARHAECGSEGLARHVRAEGHAQAGDRQAVGGAAEGRGRPGVPRQDGRAGRRGRAGAARHAGFAAHLPGRRNQQVDPGDQEGRRVRGLSGRTDPVE
ncbi:hypothetical protein CBM2623_A40017 [Cupriavidus taiwanensis]|nr:hypothetical protein CBM2608_A30017 [Cupriavidus taiwanensis]SPA29476.1 hypothetical protein CBM2623_A40017 [Cupriavidus taiwanensis]